jgi:hypothetical protein
MPSDPASPWSTPTRYISIKGTASQKILACAAERSPPELIFDKNMLLEKFKFLEIYSCIRKKSLVIVKELKENFCYIRFDCSNKIVLNE